MQIVVDSLLTHYELIGKGKLVVLLHGWGDRAAGLSELQQHLSKHYRVLALDLPGFGATQTPSKVWDLDNYGDFVAAVLQKLDLGQPYAIIGHSNGGALAIRAISLRQLKPQKLVLMAASGIRAKQTAKRASFKVVAKVGKIATAWLPQRHRRALRKRLYGVVGSDLLVAPHLQATFKRTVRQDVQADAAKLTVPTLLLFGVNDKAVPLADGKVYHKLIKDSKFEVISDAEHFIHLDQPGTVTTLIEEFLA